MKGWVFSRATPKDSAYRIAHTAAVRGVSASVVFASFIEAAFQPSAEGREA